MPAFPSLRSVWAPRRRSHPQLSPLLVGRLAMGSSWGCRSRCRFSLSIAVSSRTVQPRSLPIHWSVLPPPIRAQHSYLNRVDRCINSQPLRAFELSFSRLGQFPRQVSRRLGLQRVCQHHVLVSLWKIFEAAEQAEDT